MQQRAMAVVVANTTSYKLGSTGHGVVVVAGVVVEVVVVIEEHAGRLAGRYAVD
jgi:hypothetical protein